MVLLISMMSVSTLGPSRQLSGRMSRRVEPSLFLSKAVASTISSQEKLSWVGRP